jgi:fumarate hydratase class II
MELNVNMPVIAWNILDSIEILGNGIRIFSKKCVEGIKSNDEHCKELAEMSTALVTALSPKIGYTKATELAKEAYRTDKKIKDLAIEKGILSKSEADEILNPKNLI